MLTDNEVLVNNLKQLPSLMCAQRRAEKCIPTDADFIRSNIDSFGNEIGQTTNWITSMFEVQARYPEGSQEYETLAYRIMCGQLYQQNSIDKAKGIVCKPMPRSWHDRHAVASIEDDAKREFYRSIIADKKPYFMRYIYPALMKEYNTYIKNTEKNAMREFGMGVDGLLEIDQADLNDRQREFLYYYNSRMPVGTSDCVMNRICRIFEVAFSGATYIDSSNKFDYTIMKSGAEYTKTQYQNIKHLYSDYNKRLADCALLSKYDRLDQSQVTTMMLALETEFRSECSKICPDRFVLCDIILDLCYGRSSSKRFAWSMCGSEIIENLLAKNGGVISWPEASENGDIMYCGNHYEIKAAVMKGEEYDDCDE